MSFGSLMSILGSPQVVVDDPTYVRGVGIANAALAQQAQQDYMLAAQQNWHGGSTPPAPPSPAYLHSEHCRRLFLGRMGGVRGNFALTERDFLHCQLEGDLVFVFFLLNGKEGVVKEQADMFPSDTLIAQFRMIVA